MNLSDLVRNLDSATQGADAAVVIAGVHYSAVEDLAWFEVSGGVATLVGDRVSADRPALRLSHLRALAQALGPNNQRVRLMVGADELPLGSFDVSEFETDANPEGELVVTLTVEAPALEGVSCQA